MIAFFGNYLINNVAASIAAFVPAAKLTSTVSWQYVGTVTLAAVSVAIVTWWFFRRPRQGALVQGIIFGVLGFAVVLIATYVSAISSAIQQTGSFSYVPLAFSQVNASVFNWPVLIILGVWIIPATIVGWWFERRAKKSAPAAAPQPAFTHQQ